MLKELEWPAVGFVDASALRSLEAIDERLAASGVRLHLLGDFRPSVAGCTILRSRALFPKKLCTTTRVAFAAGRLPSVGRFTMDGVGV